MTPLPSLSLPLSPVIDFFIQGGLFMIPLMICSVVSVAVIIMRGLALRRPLVLPPEVERAIDELQPRDDASAVVRLARVVRSSPSPLSRIAHTGLQHLQWPRAENVEAVQTRARQEVVKMESGLFILEIVVGIAPLLGLLGAVSGLVTVFGSFGASGGAADPRGIAAGISEALTTTLVGLAVAIPSLIAWSYFSRRVEIMAADMEGLIADLLTKCYYHKQRKSGGFSGRLENNKELQDLL